MAGEPQRTVTVAVAGLAADVVTVDALARLALAVRRSGCEVRLCGASPALLGLVELIGLAEVLRAEGDVGAGGAELSDAAAIRGALVTGRARSGPSIAL